MPSAKGPKSSLPLFIQRKHSQAESPPAYIYIANLNETALYVDHKKIKPMSLHSTTRVIITAHTDERAVIHTERQ